MKYLKYSRLLLAAAASSAMLAGRADAAPVGSAYRSTMDALQANYYFPLDEAPGTQAGAALVNHGSTSAPQARYVTTGPAFNDGQDDQLRQLPGYATVGATVGPTVTNKFFNPNNAADVTQYVANQLPGFNPDLRDPPVYNAVADVNRAFEANARGAIQLNQTVGGNTAFHGDANTHELTIAMWVRNEDMGSNQFPRLYEAGGDNGANGNFLQLVAAKSGVNGLSLNTDVSVGRTVQVGYAAPGWRTGGEGIHNDGQWTFIVASLNNDPALSPAERAATIQIWERDRDATHLLDPNTHLGAGASNRLGIAKIGYRDGDPGSIGTAQTVSDSMDEVGIWNRILQYDEKEALYVSATRPAAGDPNATSADGSWTAGGNWSKGNYPQHHGNNNASYQDITVNHHMTVESPDPANTAAWRTNMYNLTVNGTGALAMNPGTVLRTADNAVLNGNIAMNGAFGTVFGSTFTPTALSKLDIGKDGSIGAVNVTMASPQNQIIAEENLTIDSGASFSLASTAGAPASGAHLFTVAQADYDAGSGSVISGTGVLTGRFGTHNLPAADGLGRRASVLYENRSDNGVGAVDTMKVGLARPGDTNFDGVVDFTDAVTLTSNYGFSGKDWRAGHFSGATGTVGFTDATELISNYGFNYATTIGTVADSVLSITYDQATGQMTIETTAAQVNTLTLASQGGLFHTAEAGWLSLGAPAVTFTSDTAQQQGFGTLTALGGSFLPGDGYVIGALLPAGLSEATLLADLTITYSVQGVAGLQTGDLIFQAVPEPSSLVLVTIGLIGLVSRRRRAA